MEQHQHYQSLQDQAYNALRSKIIYAELKPGTRLSAIGLEKETGIGRTPIRESFVRLREQELVETRPKSGTYVSKISMEHAVGSLAEFSRPLKRAIQTRRAIWPRHTCT